MNHIMNAQNNECDSNVQAIQDEIPAIARHFGWGPNIGWIQQLQRDICVLTDHTDIHALRYAVYRQLDPSSHIHFEYNMFVVSTGYAAYAPNPVNLLFDKMSDQQLDRDDIVCIDIARSCAEITLRDGHTIAAFTSCGHAYDDSTGQASQNSASLLSDLTDGAITTAGYFAVNMSSFCQMTWQRDRGGSWNRHPRIIRR